MVRHGLADGFGRGNAPIGGTDIGYFVVDANGREGLLFLAALAANVNGGARELCGGGLGERERCVCVCALVSRTLFWVKTAAHCLVGPSVR